MVRGRRRMRIEIGEWQVRSYHVDDVPSLARHADNRNISRNMRDTFPYPYTLSDANDWISLVMLQSPEVNFAIASADEVIGGIGLTFRDDIHRRSAEIGYGWVNRSGGAASPRLRCGRSPTMPSPITTSCGWTPLSLSGTRPRCECWRRSAMCWKADCARALPRMARRLTGSSTPGCSIDFVRVALSQTGPVRE